MPRSERIVRRAACTELDHVGQCVRVHAPRTDGLWQIEGVTSDTITAMTPASGVIIKKVSSHVCFVQFHGTTPPSVYAGLTPGRAYVVGTDGYPATEGDANYPGFLQQIGVATSEDELLVQPVAALVQPVHAVGGRLYEQPLLGARDGNNTDFTTELCFIASGPSAQVLYLNGQRLRAGDGNDYTVGESGGPGTGFNTITLHLQPDAKDHLTVDFVSR